MNHLLIDVDSKIPNLALMKISKYLKQAGDTVELIRLNGKLKLLPNGPFESVWISCVFTWNRQLALYCDHCYGNTKIGGSGVSLRTKLPAEIENMVPDYSLYGDDRAIGFIIRGCIRRCDFCAVSEKEGKITENPYRPIESWVPEGFKKVILLDNEFAAFDPVIYPAIKRDIEKETLDTIQEHGWKYSITQGYDLRCIAQRPFKAKQLAAYKPKDIKLQENRLYVAWDYFDIEPYVRKGIEALLDAGFLGREIMCYCLVGQRSTHVQDYHRFKTLWEGYGVLPFLMRYRPLDGSPRKNDPFLDAFCRFVNRGPASYRNHSFVDYCHERAPEIVAEAESLS